MALAIPGFRPIVARMTMKKYGNVEPTEAERQKAPRADIKTAAQKQREAREDGLRKPKAK